MTPQHNQIGLIARSDNTGLGIQTHEFYKHIHPEKTLVVDVGALNKLEQYHHRYPGCKVVLPQMSIKDMEQFLDGLKVIFCCETPYNYELFKMARNRGVKIILQYNYEFLEYKNRLKEYYPDIFASPSLWNIDQVKFPNILYLPVPINRQLLPYTEKKQFKRFLHIAGTTSVHDRNGTTDVLQAFASLNREDIQLVVKCFNKEAVKKWGRYIRKNISISTHNTLNYEHNYIGFDILILPRKYGGLCLPMQEALSCGMPVIMTDISPNNDILPLEWLIPSDKNFQFQASYPITVHQPNIKALSEKIDQFANMHQEEAIEQSKRADSIAKKLDWEIWKEKYIKLLNS